MRTPINTDTSPEAEPVLAADVLSALADAIKLLSDGYLNAASGPIRDGLNKLDQALGAGATLHMTPLLGEGAALTDDESRQLWERQKKALRAGADAGSCGTIQAGYVIRAYLRSMQESEITPTRGGE